MMIKMIVYIFGKKVVYFYYILFIEGFIKLFYIYNFWYIVKNIWNMWKKI